MRKGYLFLVLLVCCISVGCAATQVAIEKKDLSVQTKMSETIFLDAQRPAPKTVLLDLKNTAGVAMDIKPLITRDLQAKGYTVVQTPAEASYILQGNILYVGKADPSALDKSLYSGYGGVVAGAAAGAMIGGATHGGTGAAYGAGIGGLAGGAAEMVSGSLVKDVTYTIVTDVLITENVAPPAPPAAQTAKTAKGKKTNVTKVKHTVPESKKYQTRIVSTANKVNLKLEEALPALTDGLSKSIAGIF